MLFDTLVLNSTKYSPIRRLGSLPIYGRTVMFSSGKYILSTFTGDEVLQATLL